MRLLSSMRFARTCLLFIIPTLSMILPMRVQAQFIDYPVWVSGLQGTTNSVALGDVDADGDLDLVCGNAGGRTTLYQNDAGKFELAPIWSSAQAANTRSVALGDVDGDGYLELVCGNYNQSTTVYDDSAGAFESMPVWSSSLPARTMSIALGDVDGDGDLDLVCGNYDESATLYENIGGTFADMPAWYSAQWNWTTSIALGDVDGDGDLDLVCGNDFQSTTLYKNTGRIFEDTPVWSSGQVNSTTSVALGDVDGDGDLDLVCGNYDETVTLYENTGGTFADMPIWSSGHWKSTTSVALGDVDGDGDLDLVCGNDNYRIMLYENPGSVMGFVLKWNGPIDGNYGVALGDTDGDGDLDLVCGNHGWSATLYENAGYLLESLPAWSSGPESEGDTRSVALGDVDGDGYLELVCGNYNQSTTVYDDSAGAFESMPVWSSSIPSTTMSVALGDVDGDGDLDLVCGNHGWSTILYRNTGGTFEDTPIWYSAQWNSTASVALGDVDGDRHLELVCGNYNQRTTVFDDSAGAFESMPKWSSGLASKTQSVALGDVDGDGDLDLVCGNYDESTTLYENIGGTFASMPKWSSGLTNSTYSVTLGDVDGDGNLDLVCGNHNESTTLYQNTGGTFESTPSWFSGITSYTRGVALGDVNGDGYLDLICGNYCQSTTLYININGTLASMAWSSGLSSITWSVALGDVDGDGDLDLVCGNSNYNTYYPLYPICNSCSKKTVLYENMKNPVYKGDFQAPTEHLPNNGPFIRADSVVVSGYNLCQVAFTAYDVESDRIWIAGDYQFEGEPQWFPFELAGGGARIGPLIATPLGATGSLEWDISRVPFDRRRRNIVLRLRAIEIPRMSSVIQHAPACLKEIGPLAPYRPEISTADAFSFPAVTLGETTYADLKVTNTGTASLTIMKVVPPTADVRPEEILPIHISPRNSANLRLTFVPSSDVNLQGNLVIESDDPFSPSRTVEFTGTVRPMDFTLANLYYGGEIDMGTALAVSMTMQDSVHVDSACVFFREGGKASFDSLGLQRIDDPVNDQYLGSIPASMLGARGIEYFVRVYHNRFIREGPIRRLRTRVKSMELAGTPPAERYGMISLPLAMEGPILGILADDLGGVDNTKWRMWAYEDTATPPDIELPNATITQFEVGRGYWLITREGKAIDTGPAEGLSTPTDGPFEVILRPGWSMLGSPFAFPVAWSAIEVDTLSMSEAEIQGVIEPLWRWVPSTGRYEQGVEVLKPFEAYWVKNTTDPPREIVLRVPAEEASAGTLLAEVAAEESGAWEIGIRVACGEVGIDHNRVGARPGATELHDFYDRSEPPMGPGESMSLYFPHFGWGSHAGRYAVDIRGPESEAGHAWAFDVAKNFSREAAGDEVVLEFSGVEGMPVDCEVILIDRKLDRRVDLKKETRYAFFQGKRDHVKRDEDARFELLVGSAGFIHEHEEEVPKPPAKTVLHQNHPNPFNPSTIIQYDLAEPGRVTLRIYDVSGSLVSTLEDRDRQPGRYEIGWNGENDRGERVASGMYFYRLTAPGYAQTRKIVLVR